jgi:magnesium transporter
MIVDCAHYENGARQRAEPMSIADAADCAANRGGFIWLGLADPTEEELASVQSSFPLHELAIEDASAPHQRAKMEDYGNHYFVVLRTAQYNDQREEVEFGEIHIFAGAGFVISVRHGAESLQPARKRLEERPELLEAGPISVIWAVLDKVVDDYEPVVDGLAADIEDAEVRVFAGEGDQTERIYFLKREVIEFYRAVHPLLAPLAAVERGADPRVGDTIRNYFRDVNDHVQLVHEEVASHRELLTSILEANLAVLGRAQNEISVRQNESTKQLTVIATIFLPLAFVTGFFGQNFGWLVGHIHSFWVFALYGLGSLAVSCALLFLWFRRSGYF